MFKDRDLRFDRVHISRRRVHEGLGAIAMGLLAATLSLDLLYAAVSGSGYYDTAWFALLAGAIALVAAIVPGIFAWVEEARASASYTTRDDDGRAVVLMGAVMIAVVNLVLRVNHGAVIGPELGTAVALSIATLGLMVFAGPIGDWLAERFPAGRRGTVVDRSEELARERETTLKR